jgi:hypothetical protein
MIGRCPTQRCPTDARGEARGVFAGGWKLRVRPYRDRRRPGSTPSRKRTRSAHDHVAASRLRRGGLARGRAGTLFGSEGVAPGGRHPSIGAPVARLHPTGRPISRLSERRLTVGLARPPFNGHHRRPAVWAASGPRQSVTTFLTTPRPGERLSGRRSAGAGRWCPLDRHPAILAGLEPQRSVNTFLNTPRPGERLSDG